MTDPPIDLITGATKGIGRAIAGQLASRGHPVVVDARFGRLDALIDNAAISRPPGDDLDSLVSTNLDNYAGDRTPDQGAVAAVRMAAIPPDGPTGTFTDDLGEAIPW